MQSKCTIHYFNLFYFLNYFLFKKYKFLERLTAPPRTWRPKRALVLLGLKTGPALSVNMRSYEHHSIPLESQRPEELHMIKLHFITMRDKMFYHLVTNHYVIPQVFGFPTVYCGAHMIAY